MSLDARLAEPYHARLEALAGDVAAYIAKRAAVRRVSADAAMSATLHHLQAVLQDRVDARRAPSQTELLECFYGGDE